MKTACSILLMPGTCGRAFNTATAVDALDAACAVVSPTVTRRTAVVPPNARHRPSAPTRIIPAMLAPPGPTGPDGECLEVRDDVAGSRIAAPQQLEGVQRARLVGST